MGETINVIQMRWEKYDFRDDRAVVFLEALINKDQIISHSLGRHPIGRIPYARLCDGLRAFAAEIQLAARRSNEKVKP